MPRWFDLSSHGVALRLGVSAAGQEAFLVLQPQERDVDQDQAQRLGFNWDDGTGAFVRQGTVMSLGELRQVYPQAQVREFARDEIRAASGETQQAVAASPDRDRAALAAARLSDRQFGALATFLSDGERWRAAYEGVELDVGEVTDGAKRGRLHAKTVTSMHAVLVARAAKQGNQHATLPAMCAQPKVAFPSLMSRGRMAELNIMKLLNTLDIAGRLMEGESAALTLRNPPFKDLVIERHREPCERYSDKLYLTHYHKGGGDMWIDGEMVFGIAYGRLWFHETATYSPFSGGELREHDRQFANMFSRNLIQQGFPNAQVVARDAPALDPTLPTGSLQAEADGFMLSVAAERTDAGWVARWSAGSLASGGMLAQTEVSREDVVLPSAADALRWGVADARRRVMDLTALGDGRIDGSAPGWAQCCSAALERVPVLAPIQGRDEDDEPAVAMAAAN